MRTPLLVVGLTLSWTAPGDDGLIGQIVPPGRYEMRFSTDSTAISTGAEIALPPVGAPGSTESADVSIPGPGFIGLRTSDEAGNWAPWRLIFVAPPDTTPPAPPLNPIITGTEP